ncbi:G kinase-anchoring protein 1-like [Leguminivora glycinivorella]|uniref:G kinase-anchoring protein 1-like n=1 Tax=Leguminivora glycinivorella TaxID=1035111 RepID=UPI00200D69D4|nr:G kinase-anchoring protein 1-like [Leguminivora glycinivorella]
MAGLVVQSRFAGLQVEDEDFCSDEQKKKNKNSAAKKVEPPKKAKPAPAKTQVAKKKKPKQAAQSSNQWELWKQKDEQLVDGNFEDELQQAILLSKLDYEEKKDVYQQIKKEAEITKKKEEAARTTTKKQKKKNVMSLDQFNDMVAGDESKTSQEDEKSSDSKPDKPKDDTEFFERVKSETKNELLKDKIIDRVKSQTRHQTQDITKAQFVDTLEKKDKEIHALKEEVTNLKKELLTVKSRNKKLCSILGQGEMKDKAEVLVEVERLRAVQSELTAEIASLHTDLEKERSKNADPRAKDKKNNTKKKNIRFDVSSEALISKESSSGTA